MSGCTCDHAPHKTDCPYEHENITPEPIRAIATTVADIPWHARPTHFGPDVHRADYGMHGTACKPVLVLPLDGLEETIARVLGEHGWTWKAFTQRPKEAECTAPGCDWTWRVPLSGDIDPVAIHEAEKAHRADAIARALAGDGAR